MVQNTITHGQLIFKSSNTFHISQKMSFRLTQKMCFPYSFYKKKPLSYSLNKTLKYLFEKINVATVHSSFFQNNFDRGLIMIKVITIANKTQHGNTYCIILKLYASYFFPKINNIQLVEDNR